MGLALLLMLIAFVWLANSFTIPTGWPALAAVATLRAFVARASAGGGPYDVVVRIRKGELIQSIVGPQPSRTVRAVLFSQTLANFLRRGLREIEREVWATAPDPLLVLRIPVGGRPRGAG
jgi:hypothetical protein